jgi:capsular polysaccharide export protein
MALSLVAGSNANSSAWNGRHFLLVSAPFGPFGRQLADELERQGALCSRVVLNGGDITDWGVRDALTFTGDEAAWPSWLREVISRHGVTDIVTYGDSNRYLVEALKLAESLGVSRHVFEQGYFRPDWVTLERDGVNANSRLPRNPDWYLDHPNADVTPAAARVGRATPLAVARIVAYHVFMYAALPLFWRYRAPYQHSALHQAIGHCGRFVKQRLSAGRQRRLHDSLVRSRHPLYLVLLQRPGDSQLWRHSDFERTEAFLDRVVTSFAAHAPKSARLVVRPHPFDHGLDPHEPVLAKLARREGVADRVHSVERGKLHEVLPMISGAVCVNSTAGLAAVEFGCPTAVLGRALYDMPGLTHQRGLDSFWQDPDRPNAALYQAFRNVLMAATQINGAYATRRGRELAVSEAARRLLHGPAGAQRLESSAERANAA